MANEIIVMERGNGAFSMYFLYAIPANARIEIGGTGTTGQYPVLTPSDGLPIAVQLVLTQAEKDSLDAGESVAKQLSLNIPDGYSDAQVLAAAQQTYSGNAPIALEEYTHRYKYIGRRFNKA